MKYKHLILAFFVGFFCVYANEVHATMAPPCEAGVDDKKYRDIILSKPEFKDVTGKEWHILEKTPYGSPNGTGCLRRGWGGYNFDLWYNPPISFSQFHIVYIVDGNISLGIENTSPANTYSKETLPVNIKKTIFQIESSKKVQEFIKIFKPLKAEIQGDYVNFSIYDSYERKKTPYGGITYDFKTQKIITLSLPLSTQYNYFPEMVSLTKYIQKTVPEHCIVTLEDEQKTKKDANRAELFNGSGSEKELDLSVTFTQNSIVEKGCPGILWTKVLRDTTVYLLSPYPTNIAFVTTTPTPKPFNIFGERKWGVSRDEFAVLVTGLVVGTLFVFLIKKKI
jgi:hypothetical protein